MISTSPNPSRGLQAAEVACLLIVLALQLALSARRESQTWDEACHIFAGYNYWKNADFGDNPEHPPLVKLLATLPLLRLPLNVPPHPGVFSKEEDFLTATQFVYSNDAEMILFRTRMAAALLTLLLGLLVFAAAKEMFGLIPAFLALALLVFEPNILAHGAVVTTDVGFSCFLLATVYAFYRYVKKTGAGRLALTRLAAGFGLATKHSAILIPRPCSPCPCVKWYEHKPARSRHKVENAGSRRRVGWWGRLRSLASLRLRCWGHSTASISIRKRESTPEQECSSMPDV